MFPTDDDGARLGQDAADTEEARSRWQGEGRVAPERPRHMAGAGAPNVASRRERPMLPYALMALIALGGGGARLATADWGLPYALHVDEKGFVVHEALAAEYRGLTRGDFRPYNTSYGPLVFEVVIGMKWALFGGRERARALAAQYPTEWEYITGALRPHTSPTTVSLPELLYGLRALAAALGALTIWWLALAAARLETPRTGVVAALLAVASVGLFQVGHFFTPESLLMPALALFLHACAKLATEPARLGSVLQAGLALALIAGSKGPGLVCGVALPAALASHARVFGAHASGWRVLRATLRAFFSAPFLLSLLVAALFFAAMNPWLVSTDPGVYFRGIAPNRSGTALLLLQFTEREFDFYDWRFVYNDGLPLWPQLRTLLPFALGGPACVAAYVALARGLRRRSGLDRIVFWSVVPPLLLVGGFAVATLRYVLPAVPGLILGAASLLSHPVAWSAPAAASRSRLPTWAQRPSVRSATDAGLALVSGLVVAFTCARGAAYAWMFDEPDPRVLAGRYLAEHAQPGDVVVLEPEGSYTAVLNDDYDLVGRVDLDGAAAATGTAPRFLDRAVPSPTDLRVRRLFTGRPGDEALAAHLEATLRRARFVVVGDWYHRRALHPSAVTRAPLQRAFYADLFAGRSGFRVAARFAREPRFPDTDWGYRWDEADEEALSVCFDHMPVTIFERAPGSGPSAPSLPE